MAGGQSMGARDLRQPGHASAIAPSILAIKQFDTARPEWHKYLSGEAPDAKTALTAAMDAVRAEFKRQTGKDAQ